MGENESTNPPIPPKVDLKKIPLTRPPEAAADEAGSAPGLAKKQTARIEVPLADLSTPKKKTSRIGLDAPGTPPQGVPVPGGQPLPKTIVIKPPAAAAAKVSPPPIDPIEAAKKMTSRIALETALTAGDGTDGGQTGSPTTPKTIRIKRPSQAATIKLTRPDAPPEAPSASETASAKSKTSRIDIPVEAIETEAPTQKKTIKIRRPDATKGVKSLTIARPEGESATVAATVVAGAIAPDETPEPSVGAIFTITALASVLVIGVLLYVLAAQAFPGLGLSVPGLVSL